MNFSNVLENDGKRKKHICHENKFVTVKSDDLVDEKLIGLLQVEFKRILHYFQDKSVDIALS